MSTPQVPGVGDHAAPEDPHSAQDARNRAIRTVIQGLLTDVLVAVALVVYDALQTSSEHIEWKLLAMSVAKTALITVASYVMRKVKPPVADEP